MYPFDNIRIYENDSVSYFYSLKELKHELKGFCLKNGENINFFKSTTTVYERKFDYFLFGGTLNENAIKIPAYGCKFISGYGTDGVWYGFSFNDVGIPNPDSIIKANGYWKHGVLYIQKFNLVYQ